MIKQFRVLLALESEQKNKAIQQVLDEFYVVQVARDAEEVYSIIHQFQPDLAVLDYSLTNINPIELHEGIEFLHPHTKFVICVTNENLEIAKRIWLHRSIDYIRKPIGDDHIIDDINKLVRHILDQREIKGLQEQINRLKDENEKLRKLL
ncbi:MAG: response regulator [Candidatus Omnitrophica bacterium]|nr:response regulator [Candidatus Omnitrophota bacterium]